MNIKKIIKFSVIFVIGLFLVFNSFTTISPTQRGIMITLGKSGDNVLAPGMHFKAPFVQKIKKYSLSPSGFSVSFGIGDNGVVTQDLQTIGLDATIYWQYQESMLIEAVNKYDSSSILSMLKSAMLSSLKEVLGHYTVQEIIENQSKVAEEVKESMTLKMNDKPVEITMVTISNYNWSADYDKMINETMLKKQQVKQAEQEVQITELNAQKQVKEAEAQKQARIVEAEAQKQQIELEAEANLIKAQKEAEAKKIEADAMAYYYEQLSKNIEVQKITKQLDIDTIKAERWDGNMFPRYIPITAAGTVVSFPSN